MLLSTKQKNFTPFLPTELWTSIFEKLSKEDFATTRLVCKTFKSIVEEEWPRRIMKEKSLPLSPNSFTTVLRISKPTLNTPPLSILKETPLATHPHIIDVNRRQILIYATRRLSKRNSGTRLVAHPLLDSTGKISRTLPHQQKVSALCIRHQPEKNPQVIVGTRSGQLFIWDFIQNELNTVALPLNMMNLIGKITHLTPNKDGSHLVFKDDKCLQFISLDASGQNAKFLCTVRVSRSQPYRITSLPKDYIGVSTNELFRIGTFQGQPIHWFNEISIFSFSVLNQKEFLSLKVEKNSSSVYRWNLDTMKSKRKKKFTKEKIQKILAISAQPLTFITSSADRMALWQDGKKEPIWQARCPEGSLQPIKAIKVGKRFPRVLIVGMILANQKTTLNLYVVSLLGSKRAKRKGLFTSS